MAANTHHSCLEGCWHVDFVVKVAKNGVVLHLCCVLEGDDERFWQQIHIIPVCLDDLFGANLFATKEEGNEVELRRLVVTAEGIDHVERLSLHLRSAHLNLQEAGAARKGFC